MKSLLVLCTLFFVFLSTAHSQEQPPPSRPKIGIVLSGGGARGFAHIGVLQWFEEHRIPVDKIAGTSMGGLVGGMYATGMSPEELRAMIKGIDWADLFRSVPKYETLSFRRKEDRLAFPNSLELGLKGGLKFPPGVNPGHTIGLLLDRYTIAYSGLNDFDDLPISFRCIATDMVGAKQVVLGEGSLPAALQATMAIPGVFYPMEFEGKILASDGGLLNNVPTDVAEEMGADIIVAVNIGTPLAGREALDSLGGMLGQTIAVSMEQNIRRNLDKNVHPKLKVVLTPDLKTYTTFSFEDFEAITNLGYEEAEKMSAELLPYALDEAAWAQYVQDRASRVRKQEDLPVPQSIRVTGTNEASQATISEALEPHIGKELDPVDLGNDLTILWGRGRYAGFSYYLDTATEPAVLSVQAREKTYAPPFLNLGLEINNTQTDVFDFNLRARVTLMDLLSQGTEWRLDGSIGSDISIAGEYYKQIKASRFFVAPRAYFRRTKSGAFREGIEIGEYQLQTAALGADIGYGFGNTSELRLGYDFGREEGTIRIGDPELPEGEGKFSKMGLHWFLDSTDSAVIPTKGMRVATGLEYNFDVPLGELEADEEFPQAFFRASLFKTFAERNTLFVIGETDTSFDHSVPGLNKFQLGGLLRVSAASRNEFLGDHLLYFNVGYLRKLADLPFLFGDKLSAGFWYETGSAYDKWDDAEWHHSISAGIIAETFLGPIFLGLAFGDDSRNNFFVAIGRGF